DILAGHAYSRIFVDTSSLPWAIKGRGRFDGIDIRRLGDAFSFFKHGRGVLSGYFDLQASKQIELDGALNLHQGDFEGSDFQKWMAKLLQMPSLSHIGGMELSTCFKIEGRAKMFDDINLITQEFNLNGFYHLDEDDFVTSRLALRFSKNLLSESPIGRQVIGLVYGAWTLPFEFRLSGNLYRENFQWDTSPLKDRIREHLFSFFARMIDERLDQSPIP
ncbi:MAG: hypothetical protein KGJ11_09970, partial [Candidatus Omnitrophica bacterium]|nr:hypothetical protein [Candidatus Omnitrophota bacterium]